MNSHDQKNSKSPSTSKPDNDSAGNPPINVRIQTKVGRCATAEPCPVQTEIQKKVVLLLENNQEGFKEQILRMGHVSASCLDYYIDAAIRDEE